MSGVMPVLREVEAKVLEDHRETDWLAGVEDVDATYAEVLRKAAIRDIARVAELGPVTWYDVAFNGLLLAAAEVAHVPQREALIALIAVLVARVLNLDRREGAFVPAEDGPKVVYGTAHADIPWNFGFTVGEDECAA